MEIYTPAGDVGPEPIVRTPAHRALHGLRIGVLDNGKPNAGALLTRVAEQLALHAGAHVELVTDKGPGGNAATPCTPEVMDQLTERCDVVLTGSADCGSCTSWSVHDTIELERAGVPAVVATTTDFVELTRRVAAGFGLPDARIAVFPHPLGGTEAATIRAWADAAVPEVVSLLT